jgi:DNA (cytosine-5)-methyltransferase 1
MLESRPTFLEFFAGGGMVRAGLGESWRCLRNEGCNLHPQLWRRRHQLEDVAGLTLDDLPFGPSAALAWASFPCQDLSLAGAIKVSAEKATEP